MTRSNMVILVIEDNEDDQFLIKHAFAQIKCKHRVMYVSSGFEAIKYLKGEGIYSDRAVYPYPALITTDLRMPDGDGFDVLFYLKTNPEWSVIPTVVLSSSIDEHDVKTAFQLGASAFHQKPSELQELCKQLSLFSAYWLTSTCPLTDGSGKWLKAEAVGKMGHRFEAIFRGSAQPDIKAKLAL